MHAVLTAVICSLVTQHPLVVLVLMLGIPALLVAQQVVEHRLTPTTAVLALSRTPEAAVAAQPVSDTHVPTIPRGLQAVSEPLADASTPAPTTVAA
jgi:anaerobic C4-dicarboxylate transporter